MVRVGASAPFGIRTEQAFPEAVGVECDFTQDFREGRRQLTVCESKSGRILAKGVDRVGYSVSEADRRR